MIGVGFGDKLVDQPCLFQGRLDDGLGGVDALVLRAVERKDCNIFRAREVGVIRRRTVERERRGQLRFARGEQLPRQASAHAESDDRKLLIGDTPLQLADTGLQVGHEYVGWDLAKRSGGLRRIGELRRPALTGKQIDRQA